MLFRLSLLSITTLAGAAGTARRINRTQCKSVVQRMGPTKFLEEVCAFVVFHTVFDANKKGE